MEEDSGKTEVVMYRINAVDVLRRQGWLETGDAWLSFCLCLKEWNEKSSSYHLKCSYFKRLYEVFKKSVMGSSDMQLYWNENSDNEGIGFLGFAQVFSDKTVSELKSSALVAYSVYVVSLNFSYSYRC